MEADNQVTFTFLSEPSDINYGGKVHGGAVMKWIDQAGYSCASAWAGGYCVTVYVGGIRFFKPIKIGDMVKIKASIIYTGRTSMHIAIDVFAKSVTCKKYEKKTHCIIVFVAVGDDGKALSVPKWEPKTKNEKALELYAKKLMQLRKDIEEEMGPFLPNDH